MNSLHRISVPISESSVVGEEPTWNGTDDDSVVVTSKNYKTQVSRGLNWHRAIADKNDFPLNISEWISKFRPTTAKKEILIWKHNANKAVKDDGFSVIASMARMACQGFPFNDKDSKMILDFVERHTKKKDKSASPDEERKDRVSVQDRMKSQIIPVLSNLDATIDLAFEGGEVDVESIKVDILRPDLKAPHFGLIEKYLNRNINEWNEAYNKKDEQLVEGYAYVPRKRFKAIIDMFTDIRSVLSKQASAIRVRRIMKKKPTDKKKLVKSLKYLKEFPELGLSSAPAIDILGASIVWVYDTKKKRIGFYGGDGSNSLFVKGTTVLGTKDCKQKTLRKPKEQMAQFSKLRKNQIMNWFDAIRSKDLPLNGRTNNNTILLRAD